MGQQNSGKKGGAIVYQSIVQILQRSLRAGDRVLEIGCGGKQYRPFLLSSCQYSGLDLPASRWVGEPPELPAAAEAIPTKDESFDLVFGVSTFYMHADPSKTLKECFRVLAPGGKFLAFDYTPRTLRKLRKRSPEYSNIRTWNFYELKEELVAAGFDPNSICDLSYQADYHDFPNPICLLFRRVRRWLRLYNASWMILSASKSTNSSS